MSSDKKQRRWIGITVALVLLAFGMVAVRYLWPGGPEAGPLPEWKTSTQKFTLAGVDGAADTDLLLRLVSSVNGVLSSQFDSETGSLTLGVQPEVFQASRLGQALDHTGLGWHIKGDPVGVSYRNERRKLIGEIERRLPKGAVPDEIIFQPPKSLPESKKNTRGRSVDPGKNNTGSPQK